MLDTLPPINRTTGADKSIGTIWRRKAEVDGVPLEVRDADYARALDYLGRAEIVDIARRTDQANRDLAKGFPRDMLALSGDEQIYENEVAILLALGRLAEAEDKAHTLLLLGPRNPAWHRLMSQVRVAGHKPEAAILELFEASEVSDGRQSDPGISNLFRSLHPAGCESGKEGVLNLDCPQVAEARARAHADLMQLLRESGRADEVRKLERRFGKPAAEPSGAAGNSSKLRNMSFR
jgi:predicted Zn-dependent protease